MTAKRTVLALILALLLVPAAHAGTEAAAGNAPPPNLQGSWLVTLTPEAGGPPPFLGLFTFTQDGGIIQTDAGPPTPLQFSAGHGEWERTARRIYDVTYTQLQFDAAQALEGIFRCRMTLRMNPARTQLSGKFTVDFFDLAGNLLFSGNGTAAGERLPVVEPD